jgi:DNA-binding transcriptional LysR family regulator
MSGPLPDLAQLSRFLAVAETGSFRRAADQLALTQPTLSWSIQQLEQTLGASLFERGARGARLTPAGALLLPRAKLILSEGLRVQADFLEMRREGDAQLAIGVAPTFITDVFPRSAAAALRLMPGLRLRVMEGHSGELIAALQAGDIDLALGGRPQDKDIAGLTFERLFAQRYVLVARRDHPVFASAPVDDRALVSHDWIVFDAPALVFDPGPFAKRGLTPPRIAARTSSMQFIRAMVLHSDLIGYAAEDYVRADLDSGVLREAPSAIMTHTAPAGVLVRTEGAQTHAMRVLIAELRQVCATYGPPKPITSGTRSPEGTGRGGADRARASARKALR